MIVAMDADFKASVSSCKHALRASAFANVRALAAKFRSTRSLWPVVCCDGGAQDLAEETRTKEAT